MRGRFDRVLFEVEVLGMWKEVIGRIVRIISDKGGDEFVRNSAERSTRKEQYPQRRKRTDEEPKGGQ